MLPTTKQSRKRRVQDSDRRRSSASCDRCKTRRERCHKPADGASGSSPASSGCQSCIAAGVECSYTIPRKTRVYGSVESLSWRYRAFEGLLKKIFPSIDISDNEELERLIKSHGIVISDAPVADSDLFNVKSAPVVVRAGPAPAPAQPSAISTHVSANPFAQPTHVQPADFGEPFDEKLIPTKNGASHYIGPSGSFKFVSSLRTMVARIGADQELRYHRRPPVAHQQFALPPISQVLDAPPENRHGHDSTSISPIPGGGPAISTAAESLPPKVMLPELPTRAVCDELVKAYLSQIHPSFLILGSKAMILLAFDEFWSGAGLERRKDRGVICCMVLIFGAQLLEHHDKTQSTTLQTRLVTFVQSQLQWLLRESNLENVQALMLLQLYEYNIGARNFSWTLLGCAGRMAVTLGLHRSAADVTFNQVERNLRRTVWYSFRQFEAIMSMSLGRPAGVDPSADAIGTLPDETMLDGSEVPRGYFHNSILLTKLETQVKDMLDSRSRRAQDYLTDQRDVDLFIQTSVAWLEGLPAHLHPQSHPSAPMELRHIILLHLHHYYIVSVATRHIRLAVINHQLNRTLTPDVVLPPLPPRFHALNEECRQSAIASLHLIERLHKQGILEGIIWLDGYYLYHAMIILAMGFVPLFNAPAETANDTADRALLEIARNISRVERLSSTSRTLIKIACQFGEIVGGLTMDPIVPQSAYELTPLAGYPQQDLSAFVNHWPQMDTFGDVGFGMDFAPYGNEHAFVQGLPNQIANQWQQQQQQHAYGMIPETRH